MSTYISKQIRLQIRYSQKRDVHRNIFKRILQFERNKNAGVLRGGHRS